MIVDTNALSAWAEGDRTIEPVLQSATEVVVPVVVPVVVLGEFDYGIRQSRSYHRYADWLDASLDAGEIALIDRGVAHAYGAVRLELKQAAYPDPTLKPDGRSSSQTKPPTVGFSHQELPS